MEQFKEKLKEYKVAVCDGGRPYIRTDPLIEWMRATEPRHGSSNADRLLLEAYNVKGWSSFLPISTSKICDGGHDRCAIVFSILLEIGLAHMIHDVQKRGIIDQFVPMSLADLKSKFSDIDPSNGIRLAELFDRAQWKFRPVMMTWDMDREYQEQHYLPFCRKTEIGKGGQARVFQIAVQEDYVDNDLRKRLSKTGITTYPDEVFGPCFQFALKTFEEGNITYFKDEKKAFDALKSNKGMIQYLGSFGHKEIRPPKDPAGGRTETIVPLKHILLEYGEFDLYKIFQYRLPPVIASEIQNFWTSLIEIADALKGIHQIKTKNGTYSGWHNDIKPGNIIVVNEKYKLADPGFAKFQKKLEDDKGEDPIPKILATGGTDSYSAPEYYARFRTPHAEVTQSVDIWSMGCVLSMAATWVVLGYQGIYQYNLLRQKAIQGIVERSSSDPKQRDIDPGDFFHNGKDILPEVKQWHQYLRSAARQTDQITTKILDLVEKYLLVANKRMTAERLYERLQKLLQDNKPNDIPVELEDLMGFLCEIDEEAISSPEGFQQQQITTQATAQMLRSHTKGNKLQVPPLLKTASRYEALAKITASRSPRLEARHSPKHTDVNGFFDYTAHPQGNGSQVATNPYLPTEHTPPPLPPKRISTFRLQNENTPAPQNVIQAREEFRDTAWYKKTKDNVLQAHFDNRDIIFLVDNAPSMEAHWDEATYLLETLVMKAKPYDDDGMELFFTLSPRAYAKGKDAGMFREKMREQRPRKGTGMSTDMVVPIDRIFKRYFDKLDEYDERKRKGKKPKEERKEALTLIVLTDGVWAAMQHSDDVFNYMKTILLKELERRKILRFTDRPVSIEFVQFGNNDDATERLRALDDDMEFGGYKDIIDTEMFSVNGDVRKMLIGSFVASFDRLDTVQISPPVHQSTFASLPPSGALPSRPQSMYSVYNHAQTGRVGDLPPIAELAGQGQNRTPTNSTGSSAPYQTPPERPPNRSSWLGGLR
ncbi:kinase-like domain-containing protein [Lophiotrema nucula]|uniref:Kinase-like domain-containing protein n=1 Tax=Lophiotrema nucula TaxID=690887 RepID=A0A6A5Z484_9PLEO|nr:kinase-like domain-containing protein [Lophiotrema nucula]